MIDNEELVQIRSLLSNRTRGATVTEYDSRIDDSLPPLGDNQEILHLVKHQVLLRCYQSRYIILPQNSENLDISSVMAAHYEPRLMSRLDGIRVSLEEQLISPQVEAARNRVLGYELATYIDHLPEVLTNVENNEFIKFLHTTPDRRSYYENFLIQSSSDLLAEASASALGVVGDYGDEQSALFRILIDEFGYGCPAKKHSMLFRRLLNGFNLCTKYNGYWQLLDAATLELHNVIHFLFQNPRNFFLQIGFLLYAEASYKISTAQHFMYLRRFHPTVDAQYFKEHAHIDDHHASIVANEVALPLATKFGPEVSLGILTGAELTRTLFEQFGAHILAVSKAFDRAASRGGVEFGLRSPFDTDAALVVPTGSEIRKTAVQIGGIGVLENSADFAKFPIGCVGREVVVA